MLMVQKQQQSKCKTEVYDKANNQHESYSKLFTVLMTYMTLSTTFVADNCVWR